MFITIPKSQLEAGLRAVGHAVAARSSMPTAGHVLLATRGSQLKLAATNLELAIVTLVDAEVKEEGAVTVPFRTVADLIGSLPDAAIELRREAKPDLLIAAPRCQATAKGLDAAEFPAIEAPDAQVRFTVGAQALRQAIEDVLFAVCRDQTRPQLSGMLLRAQGDALTMVGCDGFRLSLRQLPLGQPVPEGTPDLLVPRASMLEVARGLSGVETSVSVATTPAGGQVVFATPTLQLLSRLIDGAYVDFEQVLRQTEEHDLTISAVSAEVKQAARFTQIVARDANNALLIEARPGDGGALVFQATAVALGSNTTEVAARIEGSAAKLGLDNRYLTEALGAIRTERLVLRAKAGGVRPIVLRPEPDGDARHLIMPLSLGPGS